mgnify:CR=1 FL=1
MRRIILITGGQRSGKSSYAEKLALSLITHSRLYSILPVFGMKNSANALSNHQERRGPEWTNIEEDKELSRHSLSGRTVLIDCITLWCTNFFFRPGCRYRPFPCRSQSRIRPLYGTGCHIYICHQRDRYGRHIRKRNTTEVYGYARLDEPVCGFTGR